MKEKLVDWLHRFSRGISEYIIAICVIIAGYTLVLSFFKMLWKLYTETQVGQKFMQNNEMLFFAIEAIAEKNAFFLACAATVQIAVVCLVFAFIAHVTFIKRLVWDARGTIGRIVCIAVPIALVAANFMQSSHQVVSFSVCLLPSLALFSYGFKFIPLIVPETDILIRAVLKR